MQLQLEKAARDLIRSQGVECEFYATDPMPSELVTVKRTARPGSSRFHGVAMLTIQAWAESRGNAATLCAKAVDILVGRGQWAALGGLAAAEDDVTGCFPENGPYRWDDPGKEDRSRWQATVAVDYNE